MCVFQISIKLAKETVGLVVEGMFYETNTQLCQAVQSVLKDTGNSSRSMKCEMNRYSNAPLEILYEIHSLDFDFIFNNVCRETILNTYIFASFCPVIYKLE